MSRLIKLIFNLIASSTIFNFFIVILILLMNDQQSISGQTFFILFINLIKYYGPMWLIILSLIYLVIRFFSENRFPVGIISPPTLIYFISFTLFIIVIIFYLNFAYYKEFLLSSIRGNFFIIIFANSLLVVFANIFIIFRKTKTKWAIFLFLLFLVFNLIIAYTSVLYTTIPHSPSKIYPLKQINALKTEPRKIRIVLMDGLSLNFILPLVSDQKLANFNLLTRNGVRGRIAPFKPNLSLAMTNTLLTGLKPSEFNFHSENKFKISGTNIEFDLMPQYILFRTSSKLSISAIYKSDKNEFQDYIKEYYDLNQYQTINLLKPTFIQPYFEKTLHISKSPFAFFFSEVINQSAPKYDLLKKAFFIDDFLKSINIDLNNSQYYYSIILFPGLGIVTHHFLQYAQPQLFGNISENAQKKYGWILENYYKYYDSIIGKLISSTGENELLVIISLSEYEPLPPWRRILMKIFSQKDINVYKSSESLGTIFLYEKNALKKDYSLKTVSIYDLFPTLLYYSGFPLPKYLTGEVLREIFTDEFVLNNPIDISPN